VPESKELPPLETFIIDPHSVASAFRPMMAMTYNPEDEGWMAWRYQDVARLLRDPSYKKDLVHAADGPYTRALTAGDWSMLFMDDPDHRRVRGLVSKAFSKRATEEARPWIQLIADDLLDALEPASGAIDLQSRFAVPYPVIVIADILGVDPEDRDAFKRWSEDMACQFDPMLTDEDAARVMASDSEMRDYIMSVILSRRHEPRADLISAIIGEQDNEGSQLTDAEAASCIALLLFAGNVTTTDLIGNGLLALLRNPDELAALESDPSLLPNAVEEMLRFDPPVVVGDRIATTAGTVGDCPVSRGEWIWPVFTSANRDPEVFEEPDRFDISRESIHHTSFGAGPHLCLGAPLARMETQIAIGSIIERFPHIRLADPDVAPDYKVVPGFRGLARLDVLLD